MSNPVPPIVGALSPGAWVAGAIFGSDDMSQIQQALPIYLAIQEGSPRPLQEASQLAGSHSTKQETFAGNADKLGTLLNEAWKGDAAEKANKKVKDLATSARETGTSLDTNAKNFESQATAFDDVKHNMKPMDNPPPEGSGFLDRVAPWDTGAEEAVERNQEAAKHNLGLYEGYGQTSKSNAESLTDKYGNAGNPGQASNPYNPNEREKYTPPETGDPRSTEEAKRRAEEQRRKAEEQARKAKEEAQRRAEEQRRKMEEEARRRQQEAEKRAEEQRRKMEEEARRRQEEAKRRAEEQRQKMEEEARRRQQEAEERAREAREQMNLSGSKFSPGSTAASSFSPSDFAGAGSGAGSGFGASGASGASGAGGVGAGGVGAGDAGSAAAGRASGAMGPGGAGAGGAGAGGAGGGARGGGMGGRMGGGMGGGMMGGGGGGGGKGGEDKEHKRKVMATENPNDLFGTDEKSVPPVIGDK